ncbi:MAG: FkbM family methyltransferase [Actinomycetota bacterium]
MFELRTVGLRQLQQERLRTAQRLQRLESQLDEVAIGHDTLKQSLLQLQHGEIGSNESPATDSVFDPEPELPAVLKNLVETPVALDVGANRGAFSHAALASGFRVIAFEPHPAVTATLTERFRADPAFELHACALSDVEGEADLHVARNTASLTDDSLFSALQPHPAYKGFRFHSTIKVALRTLDRLIAEDRVPVDVGVLKIDTEGHDPAVLRGASNLRPEVAIVEFWNKEFPFNNGMTSNDLPDYLPLLPRHELNASVVFWRGPAKGAYGVLVDASETPRGSWGNAVFFRDRSIADRVVEWARQTYGTDCVSVGNLCPA